MEFRCSLCDTSNSQELLTTYTELGILPSLTWKLPFSKLNKTPSRVWLSHQTWDDDVFFTDIQMYDCSKPKIVYLSSITKRWTSSSLFNVWCSMSVCSKTKIGRLSSITYRWTRSFNILRMMIRFVWCSIRWCFRWKLDIYLNLPNILVLESKSSIFYAFLLVLIRFWL